eukprot:scaffold1661_cov251-Pinguiococcus_pyrenoidosus.AAC.31
MPQELLCPSDPQCAVIELEELGDHTRIVHLPNRIIADAEAVEVLNWRKESVESGHAHELIAFCFPELDESGQAGPLVNRHVSLLHEGDVVWNRRVEFHNHNLRSKVLETVPDPVVRAVDIDAQHVDIIGESLPFQQAL